jgi:hypothetical protein
LFCTVGTLLLVACAANATVVTYSFSGYVDWIKDTHRILDGSVSLNTTFVATYSWETSTPPSSVSPTLNRYDGSMVDFTLTLGSYSVNDPGAWNSALVKNGMPDEFSVIANPRPFAGQMVIIGQTLGDADGDVLSTWELPNTLPSLSEFEERTFALFNSSGSLGIFGIITSLTPEPSAIFFLVLGIATAFSPRPQRLR